MINATLFLLERIGDLDTKIDILILVYLFLSEIHKYHIIKSHI